MFYRLLAAAAGIVTGLVAALNSQVSWPIG